MPLKTDKFNSVGRIPTLNKRNQSVAVGDGFRENGADSG